MIVKDICDKNKWKSYVKIDKGWSNDEKYCVKDHDENVFVLRLSDRVNKDRFKKEFEYITKIYSLGINTHKPVEFGDCGLEDKCFQLLEYIDGEQAEICLPEYDLKTQYKIGFDIGRQLNIMHEACPVTSVDWEDSYNRKIDQFIERYQHCGLKDDLVDEYIEFVNQHRYLLKNRSVCQNHGDFHVGNIIIDAKLDPYVIDYNRMKVADPWYEFTRIYFSFRVSPAFAKGQIEGYFHRDVPKEFFLYMKFYLLSTMISSLPWSIPFGEEEILFARRGIKDVYDTYDGLIRLVPKWYDSVKDM